MAKSSHRGSVRNMQSHVHSPDAGATAASSKPSQEGNRSSAHKADVFRDLRDRNERRARLARTRLAGAQREPQSEWMRVAQLQRQRRFGRVG
jgi:hypothetical protein